MHEARVDVVLAGPEHAEAVPEIDLVAPDRGRQHGSTGARHVRDPDGSGRPITNPRADRKAVADPAERAYSPSMTAQPREVVPYPVGLRRGDDDGLVRIALQRVIALEVAVLIDAQRLSVGGDGDNNEGRAGQQTYDQYAPRAPGRGVAQRQAGK